MSEGGDVSVMLCILSPNPDDISGAIAYWSQTEEGKWTYSVKQIGEFWSIPASQVPKQVAASATAFRIDCRCQRCNAPQEMNSRADLGRQFGNIHLCLLCLQQEAKVRHQEEVVRLEREGAARNAIWLRETAKNEPFNYNELNYVDALSAFTMLMGSESDGRTGEVRLPTADMFSPDEGELSRSVEKLYQLGALQMGKSTPLNAFLSSEDGLSFRYYPSLVKWRFACPFAEDCTRNLLGELGRIIDLREERDDYFAAVKELWWHIGRAEGRRYLNERLDQYGLRSEESGKLDEAIRYLLAKYGIAKMRFFLWKVAKDTAAYSAQRDVHKKKATNSIPGSLIRMCDRAIADSWEIKPWVLKWDEEKSLLTTMLFDRVLRTGVAGFRILTGNQVDDESW